MAYLPIKPKQYTPKSLFYSHFRGLGNKEMKTETLITSKSAFTRAFALVMMLLVFGLGGNAQTNFQSTNGNSRMKVLYVTFVDFFPMVTPEGKVLKVGKLRTEVFLPTDPKYSHWDAIRKGDPPTR